MEQVLDQTYLFEPYNITSGAPVPVKSEKQDAPDIAEGKNILKFRTNNSTESYESTESPITINAIPKQEDQNSSGNFSSEAGIEALRKAYLKQISTHLQSISQFIDDSAVHLYISRLFKTLLEYQESSPNDPFLIVTSAFYNALATDNNWVKYSAKQYNGAIDIFKQIINIKLTEKKLFELLSNLEAIGFDTNPFCIDIGDDE